VAKDLAPRTSPSYSAASRHNRALLRIMERRDELLAHLIPLTSIDPPDRVFHHSDPISVPFSYPSLHLHKQATFDREGVPADDRRITRASSMQNRKAVLTCTCTLLVLHMLTILL
jgi:hypothetical protein